MKPLVASILAMSIVACVTPADPQPAPAPALGSQRAGRTEPAAVIVCTP